MLFYAISFLNLFFMTLSAMMLSGSSETGSCMHCCVDVRYIGRKKFRACAKNLTILSLIVVRASRMTAPCCAIASCLMIGWHGLLSTFLFVMLSGSRKHTSSVTEWNVNDDNNVAHNVKKGRHLDALPSDTSRPVHSPSNLFYVIITDIS